MKISINKWWSGTLAVTLMSFGLISCGSSGGEAEDPVDPAELAAENTATATQVSMESTGSGIQMSLENLIDDTNNLTKTLVVEEGEETEDCPNGGTVTATYTVNDNEDGTGDGIAVVDMDNCGGATTVPTLDVIFDFTGYSDDGEVITVDSVTGTMSGQIEVTIDDEDYCLTFEASETTLTGVIVDGNYEELHITGEWISSGAACDSEADCTLTCSADDEPIGELGGDNCTASEACQTE